jgi:hypothetical protein
MQDLIVAIKKIRPRQTMTEPEIRERLMSQRSVAEEQPQQNNHRNRYADQPEQNSFSHVRLLDFLSRRENVRRGKGFLPAK